MIGVKKIFYNEKKNILSKLNGRSLKILLQNTVKKATDLRNTNPTKDVLQRWEDPTPFVYWFFFFVKSAEKKSTVWTLHRINNQATINYWLLELWWIEPYLYIDVFQIKKNMQDLMHGVLLSNFYAKKNFMLKNVLSIAPLIYDFCKIFSPVFNNN